MACAVDNPPTDAAAGLLADLSGPGIRLARPAARAYIESVLAWPGEWTQVKQNVSRSVYRRDGAAGSVYLKCFHSQSRLHRIARRLGVSDARCEMNFSQHLSRHGVPVQEVLAICTRPGREWVLSRGIEPSLAADAWHEQALAAGDAEGIRAATVALGRLIGQMHRHGVLHGDLHCGNILLRDARPDQPVLTDLHRMRRSSRLSRRARTANLAAVMSDRMLWTTRSQRLRFLRAYMEASGAEGTLRGWASLVEPMAERHARHIARHNEARIFANNRYFARLCAGGYRGHVMLTSKRRVPGSRACRLATTGGDWQAALGDPRELFTAPDAEVIKDSRSSLVVRRRLRVGPHELTVYIKRAHRKRAIRWLLDLFRPSRARRAFRLGHVMLDRHIYAAVPLAALERRSCGFLLDSILITEAVAGGVELNRFLNRHMAPSSDRAAAGPAQTVLWQLGRLLRRLGQEGFAHRDLKANNLLVQHDGVADHRPELVMVDLDGVSRHRRVSARQQFRGLMRLNVSLLDSPAVNHAGRLRMLLGFLRRPGAGRVNFKPYWRMLQQWSSRKIRRQIASRQQRQKAQRRTAS